MPVFKPVKGVWLRTSPLPVGAFIAFKPDGLKSDGCFLFPQAFIHKIASCERSKELLAPGP